MAAFRDLIGPGRPIDPAAIQASAAKGDDWYPYAMPMPLTPEATSQPRGVKHTFILHTESGPYLTTLEALVTYMNRQDVTGECTWVLDMDGRMAQTVPVDTRADNNAKANPFATSVETQDIGHIADPGISKTPWTDAQLAQLAGLSAWQVLHANPNIAVPLFRADQGWDKGGIDGHYRYPEWSIYTGKTCPGLARRMQIDDVLDAARWIVDWTPPPPAPPMKDDVMFLARLDTNPYHYRRGAGSTATLLRSNEYRLLLSLLSTGSAPRYHDPRTGNPIIGLDDVPVMTETELDLWIGYLDASAAQDEG